MDRYNHKEIENKWRKRWQANPIQGKGSGKPKYYCLDMFPYPSGVGLHVGHWRGYVLSDAWSRYKILCGYNVLHPMGWDAFGLPAENNAIKKGIHPSISTAENIANMKRQLTEISAIYDWDNEINTTDPGYYKWTQWIFTQMFKRGLAYEKEMPLNWCSKCKTVLANEEAVGGECDRCKSAVTKKSLRQWMLKITEYGERLLNDLESLEWPEKVKKMQSDWIGKSHGAEVDFAVAGLETKIRIYTTRPDTLFGATFMVLAPENELVEKLTTDKHKSEVEAYIKKTLARSSVDRMADKEKTGVFTGRYAINPMTGRGDMQIWISDYVLADYGTGAIMCVPAHDQRDFEFAIKYNLPITQVIAQPGNEPEPDKVAPLEEAYTGEGIMVNSGEYNGMDSRDFKDTVTNDLEKRGAGQKTINYKLRDWVFSRQRYWGEPIPIIHCEKCGPVPVPDKDLPVLLPEVESYLPTDTGESPLAAASDWINTSCPDCGGKGLRETNTMPTWAGSSWYFIRYADVGNNDEIASKENIEKWLPVDYYVGGVEHAVLHLLYARFYTKFLYDIGVVGFQEPFLKLFSQGMINRFGKKMDKSGDNGVSPDEVVAKYGCDSLRMYELFVGPPEIDSEWDDRGIEGVSRYLNKLWKLITNAHYIKPDKEQTRLRHRLICDITTRLDALHLNTVISGFMEHTNTLVELANKTGGVDRQTIESLIILISPFAPHIAEELWETIGNTGSVFHQKWPSYDESELKTDEIEIALQVNGKLRDAMSIKSDTDKETAIAKAKEIIAKRLEGAEIVKEIYVPGRIINFVVK